MRLLSFFFLIFNLLLLFLFVDLKRAVAMWECAVLAIWKLYPDTHAHVALACLYCICFICFALCMQFGRLAIKAPIWFVIVVASIRSFLFCCISVSNFFVLSLSLCLSVDLLLNDIHSFALSLYVYCMGQFQSFSNR